MINLEGTVSKSFKEGTIQTSGVHQFIKNLLTYIRWEHRNCAIFMNILLRKDCSDSIQIKNKNLRPRIIFWLENTSLILRMHKFNSDGHPPLCKWKFIEGLEAEDVSHLKLQLLQYLRESPLGGLSSLSCPCFLEQAPPIEKISCNHLS